MKKQVEFKTIYQFYHESGRVFLKGKVVIFNLYYLKEGAAYYRQKIALRPWLKNAQ